MNILYIAYSCSPYQGSEDKIGWSVPFESAKTNKVFVITKTEQKEDIDRYFKGNSIKDIEFYYVDIPNICKKVFRGSLYSGRLNVWNRRALSVARQICEKNKIDVVHQITPVEFRAIGNYDRLPDVKFVCGPLGGAEQIPTGLKSYAKGHRLVEGIRALTNQVSGMSIRMGKKLQHCDHVMFANYETCAFLQGDKSSADVVSEIAIDPPEKPKSRKPGISRMTFLVAGRLIYRKGHAFLLDALERLPEGLDYECRILGTGPEWSKLVDRCNASPKLSKHVVFVGAVPYVTMEKEYEAADVFVMPSIRETTGTVLLEAMSKGVPVITLNKFGGALLLDEDCGWLIDGTDRETFVTTMVQALEACIASPEEVYRKGLNAQLKSEQFTWERKSLYYQAIYDRVLTNENEA